MGSLSVSEAPAASLGRSEGHTLPLARTAVRRLPARLKLLQATESELRFGGRSPLHAPLVLAPVFLALSGLTWLAPTPSDGTRVLASLLCLGCALAAILTSWPRKLELSVRPRERSWSFHGQTHPLPDAPRWQLCTELNSESPLLRYVAAIQLDDGPAWPLLCDPDPAAVLRQLQGVLARWSCPVEHEWGLPEGAKPWCYEPAPAPAQTSAGPTMVRGPAPVAGLRWTMIGASVFVLLDLITLVSSAGHQVERVHVLSLVLPALLGASLVALTAAVLSLHERLSIGSELRQQACLLGVPRPRGAAVRAQGVRGVYLLAPPGSRPRHLLVDSAQGPLSLPVHEHDPEHLRDQVRRAVAHAAAASE